MLYFKGKSILISFIIFGYIAHHSSLADFVNGRCPVLRTSDDLEDINSKAKCFSMWKILNEPLKAIAFLPSSPEYKRISTFSFDLENDQSGIIHFSIFIDCAYSTPN